MIEETRLKILDDQEKFLIKCCLEDRESAFKTMEKITWKDFYSAPNGRIFKAIQNQNELLDDISELSIKRVLTRKADLDLFEEILKIDIDLSQIDGIIKFVKEQSQLRTLYDLGNQLKRKVSDGDSPPDRVVDFIMQGLLDAESGKGDQTFITPSEFLAEALERITQRAEKNISGYSYGISELDALTGGANDGNLIVIAGRPQMGKTAFALQMASYLAYNHGIIVPFFSLEMSKEELIERVLSNIARVPHWKIKKGSKFFNKNDIQNIADCSDKLAAMPLYIEDMGSCNLGSIISKCKRLKIKKGVIGPIFIDYLQLADIEESGNRDQSIGKFTRGLKRLAKDLRTPIVCLSQLSRKCEEREDKRPILSDLRESGNIEQDADVVLFVYRDFIYNRKDKLLEHEAELILAKNRHGRTKTITTEVDLDFQLFKDKRTNEGDADYEF